MNESKIRLFDESNFYQWELNCFQTLAETIKAENEEYILNVGEDDYIDHLVSKFALDPLVFSFEAADATDSEKMIPAEQFPPMSIVSRGGTYPKQVFTFHIPVSGSLGLLRMAPTSRLLWSIGVQLSDDGSSISFDVIRFGEDMAPVNSDYDAIVQKMTQQLNNLRVDVDRFNGALNTKARELFARRRDELKRKADLRGALKVPIRKNTAPLTFAVPVKSPKRIVPRPAISSQPYSLDPILDATLFQEILQLMHDFGKQLERLPDTYKGKDEETLRDHFLLLLQPHFGLEGSATGETFNAAGKTDILIRYQNQNIFVAEFKFWHGSKQHKETIDQLLSYLTWRDSKAAIIYFIEGKDVAAPLKAIEEATPLHECFVAFRGKKEESWFSYEFHLRDSDKRIHLTILCFHLPK
jgi:hypothetical protein